MKKTSNIDERKPIWLVLSEFYLDTELQESDFRRIAKKIIESPFTFKEVKKINKYEVFPVLQPNLMSVAGEWVGFNEEWLVKRIQNSLANRNYFEKIKIERDYLTLKWMCRDYWERLEKNYIELIAEL